MHHRAWRHGRHQARVRQRNAKIIGISVDSVDDHQRWKRDIQETTGHAVNYPMIGDRDLTVAKLYGMIHPNARGEASQRTAADNATVRNVYIIGPDKKIKLMLVYPMSTGRNFDEVLRVIDSLQLTAKHSVATPANWKQGEDVIIAGRCPTRTPRRSSPKAGRRRNPISASSRSLVEFSE